SGILYTYHADLSGRRQQLDDGSEGLHVGLVHAEARPSTGTARCSGCSRPGPARSCTGTWAGVEGPDLDALIERQRVLFACRAGAVEWKLHGHDRPAALSWSASASSRRRRPLPTPGRRPHATAKLLQLVLTSARHQ